MRSLLLLLVSTSTLALAADAREKPSSVVAVGGANQNVTVTWGNLIGQNNFRVQARNKNTGDIAVNQLVSGTTSSLTIQVQGSLPPPCDEVTQGPCPQPEAPARQHQYRVCAVSSSTDFFPVCADWVDEGVPPPPPPPPVSSLRITEVTRLTAAGRPFVQVKWVGGAGADFVTLSVGDGVTISVDAASREALYPLWQPKTVPTQVIENVHACAFRTAPPDSACDDDRALFFDTSLGWGIGAPELAPASSASVSVTGFTWNTVNFSWTIGAQLKIGVFREFDTGNAVNFGFIELLRTAGDGSFQDTGLTPRSLVQYSVCVLNSFGSRCTPFEQRLPVAPPPQADPLVVTLAGSLSEDITIAYLFDTNVTNPIETVTCLLVGSGRTVTRTSNRGTCLFGDVTPGQVYRAEVYAENVSGRSPLRSQIIRLPSVLPVAPEAPSIGAISASQIKLTWPRTGGLVPATEFRVERLVTGAWFFSASVPGSATSFFAGQLPPSTTQSFRICAINAWGTTCGPAASATTDALDPDAPSIIKTVDVVGMVNLRWSSPFTTFDVQRFENGSWRSAATVLGQQTAFAGLPGDVWNWRVCALVSGRRACSVDSIARVK